MYGNNSHPLWRLILNILIDCQMAEKGLVKRLGRNPAPPRKKPGNFMTLNTLFLIVYISYNNIHIYSVKKYI